MFILAISSIFLAAILGVALIFSIRQNQSVNLNPNDLQQEQPMAKANELFHPALQELAKGYAHDVNNMIAIVLLNAERLANLISEEEQVDSVEQIIQACESARFLNQQIQAIGGNQIVKKETIELSAFVEGNRFRFEHLLGNDNWLIIRFAEKINALVDPELILTAIDCLVKNASDACSKSEIWIAGEIIRTEETPQSEENAVPDANVPIGPSESLMITVKNDGILPRNVDSSKVFDPYYTSKLKSRGLGLTFAAAIVANHGGTMKMATTDEQTEVSMIIPIATND